MSLKQKIEQNALDMLNRVDDERVLTLIEKGNVKRFLSYYVDDVVVLLDTAIEQIDKIMCEDYWTSNFALNKVREKILGVLGDGKEATKRMKNPGEFKSKKEAYDYCTEVCTSMTNGCAKTCQIRKVWAIPPQGKSYS